MRCHDETMTTVVRTLRNSIRTVGKLRDKTCQLMDIIPLKKAAAWFARETGTIPGRSSSS